METERKTEPFEFQSLGRREVIGRFDEGRITSDGGGLLLREKVEAVYMIAVKQTSLLFGIFYGAMLFSERHLVRQLLTGSLIVAGVAAIAI